MASSRKADGCAWHFAESRALAISPAAITWRGALPATKAGAVVKGTCAALQYLHFFTGQRNRTRIEPAGVA